MENQINSENYNKCSALRTEINQHIVELDKIYLEHCINNKDEHPVIYDKYEVWKDYFFLLNGIIIRWDECMELLNQIVSDVIENVKSMRHKQDEQIYNVHPNADRLSYRFEDFITSFARLNEEQIRNEIIRVFPRSFREKMNNIYYKKDDVDGLYWRINLLRNRSAHSTAGAYTEHEGVSARFMSFTSKIMAIQSDGNTVKMNTTMIDLEKSEYVRDIIKTEIIDGGSDKSVQELLFPQSTPKGHGKNKPRVLFPEGYPFFYLNESFLSLSVGTMKYICDQLEVFEEVLSA